MKTINTANVSVLAAHCVIDLAKGTIVADLSDTIWVGEGYNNVVAVINIYDPSKVNLVTAVLTAPQTDVVSASLPVIDGVPKWGNYTVTVTITEGQNEYSDTIIQKVVSPCDDKTKSTGVIGVSIRPKCPLGKTLVIAGDAPQYQGIDAFSEERTIKFYYPNGTDNADLTGTFWPFYAKLVEGLNEAKAETLATYRFDTGFDIVVKYEGSTIKKVVCLSDLCAAYVALDILSQKADTCNPEQLEGIQETIDQAIKLIVLIETGDKCGYDTGDFVEQLEKLLQVDLSCPGVPPMILSGIPADTISIEGCNVNEEQIGFTKKFTINAYSYLIEVTNGQSAVTRTRSSDGCTKTTNLTFNWDVIADLMLGYFEGSKNTRFLNIFNTALNAVDPKCVANTVTWRSADVVAKFQLLVDKMCACCNTNPDGSTPLDIQMDCSQFTFAGSGIDTVGTAANDSLVIPVTVTGSGSITGTITGSGFSGTLAVTDVTEATTSITIPIAYDGSGNAGARNATVTLNYANKSISCVVVINLDPIIGCSAAINPTVTLVSNTATIRFNPAVDEPPAYEVRKRRKADPDSDAYYSTLAGSPVYNIGTGKYEISETWSPADVNKIWIYKIVSLCASGDRPFVTKEFISQTCPVITLSATTNSISYSFPHVGGEINQYRVGIYQGLTLIGSIVTKATSPSPVTGSFTSLSSSTPYTVKVWAEITGTEYSQLCTASVSTSSQTNGEVFVNNRLVAGSILQINNIPGFTLAFPLDPSQSRSGTHTASVTAISFQASGSGITGYACLRINGLTAESMAISGPNLYTFAYVPFSVSDQISIIFQTDVCPIEV